MKLFFKCVLVFLLVAFLVMQFFRPQENLSSIVAINDITSKYAITAGVCAVLKISCNNFHVNNSKYPWYKNI